MRFVIPSALLACAAVSAGTADAQSIIWTDQWGGHTYHVVAASGGGGLTWQAVENYAQALGPEYHLVTIDGANENAYVASIPVSAPGGVVWIGYNDLVSEGTWRWTSEEWHSGWHNWFSGEPNNFGGGEDGSLMWLNNHPDPSRRAHWGIGAKTVTVTVTDDDGGVGIGMEDIVVRPLIPGSDKPVLPPVSGGTISPTLPVTGSWVLRLRTLGLDPALLGLELRGRAALSAGR